MGVKSYHQKNNLIYVTAHVFINNQIWYQINKIYQVLFILSKCMYVLCKKALEWCNTNFIYSGKTHLENTIKQFKNISDFDSVSNIISVLEKGFDFSKSTSSKIVQWTRC